MIVAVKVEVLLLMTVCERLKTSSGSLVFNALIPRCCLRLTTGLLEHQKKVRFQWI